MIAIQGITKFCEYLLVIRSFKQYNEQSYAKVCTIQLMQQMASYYAMHLCSKENTGQIYANMEDVSSFF